VKIFKREKPANTTKGEYSDFAMYDFEMDDVRITNLGN